MRPSCTDLLRAGFSFAVIAGLAALQGCGVADGYGVAGVARTHSYFYVANYNSSTVASFQLENGVMSRSATSRTTGSGTSNPIFGASKFRLPYFYLANFISGNISTYSVAQMTADLPSELSNSSLISAGPGISSLTFHPTLGKLYATYSNQGGQNVVVFSVDSASGVLGTWSTAAAGVNPYSSAVTPSGSYLYVANAGSNNVSGYSVNPSTGSLTSLGAATSVGNTPRSLLMDPLGRYLYALNESSGTIHAFSIQANGSLSAVAGSPFNSGMSGPIRMAIHPSGNTLFVANNTGNTITTYGISASTGALSLVATLTPSGLTQPYGMAVDPMGTSLVVAFAGEEKVAAFEINSFLGTLTGVSSGTQDVGTGPRNITFVQLERTE